jgi:hypothetical protein
MTKSAEFIQFCEAGKLMRPSWYKAYRGTRAERAAATEVEREKLANIQQQIRDLKFQKKKEKHSAKAARKRIVLDKEARLRAQKLNALLGLQGDDRVYKTDVRQLGRKKRGSVRFPANRQIEAPLGVKNAIKTSHPYGDEYDDEYGDGNVEMTFDRKTKTWRPKMKRGPQSGVRPYSGYQNPWAVGGSKASKHTQKLLPASTSTAIVPYSKY